MAKRLQAKIIGYMVADHFATRIKAEHRFGAEIAGGIGKGLRARLKAFSVKDWRFDVAIPEYKIAIEFEGGAWSGGRHTRGAGFIGDIAKYNAATVHGWKVLRYTHTNHSYTDIMSDIARIIQPPIA